jgi:signal transduction histidine kinase
VGAAADTATVLPSTRPGRGPLVAAFVVAVGTALVMLWPDTSLPAAVEFTSSYLTLVALLDLLTAYLLLSQFATGGQPRLLALALAYLWLATAIVLPYLLIPGVFSDAGTTGVAPQSALGVWTAWHAGFPLLVALALAPWPDRLITWLGVGDWRRRVAAAGMAGAAVMAAGTTFAVLLAEYRDPSVATDTDAFVSVTQGLVPWVVALNVVAVAIAASTFRRPARGLETWAFVAVVASCGDTILALDATDRYTVAWYSARILAVMAALVVLVALLAEVTRLYLRVRRTAEALVQRNAQLAAATAMREHLLAIVSHELRTPLTAISGITEILSDSREDLPPERVSDLLDRSAALARRMTMLTEDLLAMATIDQGTLRFTPQDVDVDAALCEAAETFPGRDVRVRTAPGLTVWADPLRLQQMLANYVRNAVKYGAPPIELSARAAGGDVEIRVSDHGDGVPAEFVTELFQRFSRANDARASAAPGFGLGLSIVAKLAHLHGGRAWYDPSGPGATFVLTLPAAASRRSEVSPAHAASEGS